MPGLELPSQYQAIHHAGREGGRTERRKIMYNTNKVSPPAFIPNQFLVKEPNPEGLQAGGAGRGMCTGEESGYKMHSSKQRQKLSSAYYPSAKPTLATPAAGGSTGASLHPQDPGPSGPGAGEGAGEDSKAGETQRAQGPASPAGTVERGQASVCRQLDFSLEAPTAIWGG